MKKFRFRMEGFLKIKEFEEKNSLNEVLKQENRVLSLKSKIDDLMDLMEKSREKGDLLGRDPSMQPENVLLINDSLTAFEVRLHNARSEYLAENKLLEKLREIYNEKRKEAKVIDNFKDRQKQEFKKLANKEEQKKNNEA